MMGGRIGVKSEVGKGSEFCFTAVFDKNSEAKQAEKSLPDEIPQKRVLVVDDSSHQRWVFKKYFRTLGCRLETTSGGNEAICILKMALHQNDPFDIVFIDMHMPEMDGEALGCTIRQNPELIHTRLVMMTPLNVRRDSGHLQKAGFSGYITKPVKYSQIYKCLIRIWQDDQEKIPVLPGEEIVPQEHIKNKTKTEFRILLAEDNKINQKVALAMLNKAGYKVDLAENGKEAIKALEKVPYDIVLMDCQMPEMDGYEAAAVIRSQDSHVLNHNVPVIAMTAHAMKGDRETCLKAGMNDYLNKPVQPEDLVEMLEKWMKKSDSDSLNKSESVDEITIEEIFDRVSFLRRLGGDEELADEIFNEYMEDVPLKIEAIHSALEKNDPRRAQLQAHTLKGASANVGAIVLQKKAFEIEAACAKGNIDAAKTLGPELDTQFELLKNTVEQFFF